MKQLLTPMVGRKDPADAFCCGGPCKLVRAGSDGVCQRCHKWLEMHLRADQILGMMWVGEMPAKLFSPGASQSLGLAGDVACALHSESHRSSVMVFSITRNL